MIRINSSFENAVYNLVKDSKKVQPVSKSTKIKKETKNSKQKKDSFERSSDYENYNFEKVLEEGFKKR